jgi:DNA-binding LytR/AlgR family response regulator
MARIRAIVAEDERHVRDELVRMLGRAWPELEIVAVADNGAEAAALLQDLSPEVAFLDIRMPLQSGMGVAESAPPGCLLVFVTAYEAYAVEAFDRQAADYLLKPVSFTRLQQSVVRLQAMLGNAEREDATEPGEKAARAPQERLNWLRVADGDAVAIIAVDEVIFFQAGDKYTTVATAERDYLIRKSLTSLEQALDGEVFWRVHRGTIVNVRQIRQVRKGVNGSRLISLKDRRETLSASRAYRHLFEQM